MKSISDKLCEYFSPEQLQKFGDTDFIEEIRVKVGCPIMLRRLNKNILIDITLNYDEFSVILDKLCKRSFYSFQDSIRQGYIPLGDGFRCGISGRAVYDGNGIKNIYPIDGISIRIPHLVRNICHDVIGLIADGKSVLFYGKPGEGKTTVLRDIIFSLSDAPFYKRISVVDSRDEFMMGDMEKNALVNMYSLFERDVGMMYALRTMSPDFIVCDEIGTENDARAILLCRNSGAGIIASAHSVSFDSLLSRPMISMLYKENVFDYYIGIKRCEDNTFIFKVNEGLRNDS